MIKRNNEIVASADQNITITQAEYDKLTNTEKNNPLKTYFISDGAVAANAASSTYSMMSARQSMATYARPSSAESDDVNPIDDTSVVTGDENIEYTDTEILALRLQELIGYAPTLYDYSDSGDGTIMGAIVDLYTRLGVNPTHTDIDPTEYEGMTIFDYVSLIGDPTVLEQYDMPNVTAALADMYTRMQAAEEAAKKKEEEATAAEQKAKEAEKAAKAAEAAAKEREAEAEAAKQKAIDAENNAAEATKAAAEASIKQIEYVNAAKEAAEMAKAAAQKAADDAAVAAKKAAEDAAAEQEAKHIAAAQAAANRAESAASNAAASAESASKIVNKLKADNNVTDETLNDNTTETTTEETTTPSESTETVTPSESAGDETSGEVTDTTSPETTGETPITTDETTSQDSSTEE